MCIRDRGYTSPSNKHNLQIRRGQGCQSGLHLPFNHTTCKSGMAKAVSEDYSSPSNKHNLRICYREECQLPPFQSGPSRAMDVGYLPPNPTPRKLLFLDSGGGFLLACEDFGRMLDSLLLACALSICFLVEIRSVSYTHLRAHET